LPIDELDSAIMPVESQKKTTGGKP
jgi:hypothetical protein